MNFRKIRSKVIVAAGILAMAAVPQMAFAADGLPEGNACHTANLCVGGQPAYSAACLQDRGNHFYSQSFGRYWEMLTGDHFCMNWRPGCFFPDGNGSDGDSDNQNGCGSQNRPDHNNPGSGNDNENRPEVNEPENKPNDRPENKPDDRPETDNSAYGVQVADLVNQQRTSRGLSELSYDAELSQLAQLKAEDMAKNNYFSHQSPTYGSAFDMMQSAGISYRSAGENIARGQKTPAAVMDSWMNSQGHRENILSSSFTSIGVGYAVDSSGRACWVQIFKG